MLVLVENSGIRMQGCMAHMRRKFVDVIKAAGRNKPKHVGGMADIVLAKIGQLYARRSTPLNGSASPPIKAENGARSLPLFSVVIPCPPDYSNQCTGNSRYLVAVVA